MNVWGFLTIVLNGVARLQYSTFWFAQVEVQDQVNVCWNALDGGVILYCANDALLRSIGFLSLFSLCVSVFPFETPYLVICSLEVWIRNSAYDFHTFEWLIVRFFISYGNKESQLSDRSTELRVLMVSKTIERTSATRTVHTQSQVWFRLCTISMFTSLSAVVMLFTFRKSCWCAVGLRWCVKDRSNDVPMVFTTGKRQDIGRCALRSLLSSLVMPGNTTHYLLSATMNPYRPAIIMERAK